MNYGQALSHLLSAYITIPQGEITLETPADAKLGHFAFYIRNFGI